LLEGHSGIAKIIYVSHTHHLFEQRARELPPYCRETSSVLYCWDNREDNLLIAFIGLASA